MYLIDGGLFDNLPIKPLQNKSYDIHTLDLFAKNKIGTKKKNPIKNIKNYYLNNFIKIINIV